MDCNVLRKGSKLKIHMVYLVDHWEYQNRHFRFVLTSRKSKWRPKDNFEHWYSESLQSTLGASWSISISSKHLVCINVLSLWHFVWQSCGISCGNLVLCSGSVSCSVRGKPADVIFSAYTRYETFPVQSAHNKCLIVWHPVWHYRGSKWHLIVCIFIEHWQSDL